MTPHIRRVRRDEGLQLRALRLRALADAPMAFGSTLAHEQTFTDDVWRERAAGASAGNDRAVFIAERDGQWIGTVTGLARRDVPENVDPIIVAMFVDRAARRTGVGAGLIEAVCEWVRGWGAARVALWVTGGNESAEELYRRCGFRPTGVTRPLAHTAGFAEHEMVRDLG